jgi:hypothetical protein
MCVFFISCRGYQNKISHGNEKKNKKMCCQSRRPRINPGIATWFEIWGKKINEVHDGIKKIKKVTHTVNSQVYKKVFLFN